MEYLFTMLLKLGLIGLFIGCLDDDMPYGYYQLVKSATFIGCGVILILDLKKRNYIGILLAISFMSLFNPFYKIHFERDVWQIVDKVCAGVLFVWISIDVYFVMRRRKKITFDS